jgi:hypothetical protein
MAETRGSGVRVGSIKHARAQFCTVARVGRLVRLAQSIMGLAGPGDGPMSPSPRVMNSMLMCVCLYIYTQSLCSA